MTTINLVPLIFAFRILCKLKICEGVSTMNGGGVSILFDTSYLNIENTVLAILEATVYSETPETSNACDQIHRRSYTEYISCTSVIFYTYESSSSYIFCMLPIFSIY